MIYILLTLLMLKHFVADFLYQPPYQWQNKGTYGHPGGIVHAGQHSVLTFLIALFFTTPVVALGVSALEFVIHYHMDWFKMAYNKAKGWGTNTHPQFWVLLGVDQLVHSLTYVLLTYLIL